VAGLTGQLVAYFRRAEPREPAVTAWALAFDTAVAVAAAAGAVYEVAERTVGSVTVFPGPPGTQPLISPAPVHASAAVLIAAALTALPLAARRFYPITVWLVIAAAIVATHRTWVPPVALGTAVYAAYSAITHSRYRNLAVAVVGAVTVAVALTLGQGLPRFPGRLTAVFAIAPAAAAGLGIRQLRRRLADSTARLRRATADAEVATERALAAERARIASELHDVVTHNVSVMIVQAGAARKIMEADPAAAENALLAVEATGREAMSELRNLLGLLSPAADGQDGGPAVLRPQPGIGELDVLIDRVSAAGLPVKLQVGGEPRPLSPGAGLVVYRIVQEGLTNVLRHAGPAAATVVVEWSEELVITVSDNGSSSGPSNGAPGRGLLGLQERLALYGGEVAAGPRPDGGWQVRAVRPAGIAS
jgi:signal transduction histidine kinase